MIAYQEIHKDLDFNVWAYHDGLLQSEHYLIDKYLDKKGATLEAGTAGGRILLELQKLGFSDLYGFDCLAEFIEVAKQRDTSKRINYDVQNTVNLNYATSSFDNLLYLQQVICYAMDSSQQSQVLREAHRVLKPGGVAVFSFLSLEPRLRSPLYRLFLEHLKLLRKIRRSDLPINYLPSLKINSKHNYRALLDAEPYLYWFEMDEISTLFEQTDFKVIAVGSSYHTGQDMMRSSFPELKQDPLQGMLYVVCQK